MQISILTLMRNLLGNYIINIWNANKKIEFLIILFPCCHKTKKFECKPHDKAFDLWINVTTFLTHKVLHYSKERFYFKYEVFLPYMLCSFKTYGIKKEPQDLTVWSDTEISCWKIQVLLLSIHSCNIQRLKI